MTDKTRLAANLACKCTCHERLQCAPCGPCCYPSRPSSVEALPTPPTNPTQELSFIVAAGSAHYACFGGKYYTLSHEECVRNLIAAITESEKADLSRQLEQLESELRKPEHYWRNCYKKLAVVDVVQKKKLAEVTQQLEKFQKGNNMTAELIEVAKALNIHYDAELDAEGSGWEVPMEPEPEYFATLAEAAKAMYDLLDNGLTELTAVIEQDKAKLAEATRERDKLIARITPSNLHKEQG